MPPRFCTAGDPDGRARPGVPVVGRVPRAATGSGGEPGAPESSVSLDPPAILFGIRGSACEDALWPGKMTVGKASVPQAERAPGKCISGRPPRTPIWYLTTRT